MAVEVVVTGEERGQCCQPQSSELGWCGRKLGQTKEEDVSNGLEPLSSPFPPMQPSPYEMPEDGFRSVNRRLTTALEFRLW
jgi:hypothetical protein